jgi:NMD protein affecting ribosome stability and mRNA decay
LRGEVLDFFNGRCCFCGTELTVSRVCGDHLVPINKKDLGLHAWGNIVPACNPCNSKKHGSDWRDFIIERAGSDAAERHQRMREFLEAYPYDPQYDLGSIVADLYVEVGAIAMALIQEKIKRTKETL